jgi:transcriptional regulator with XRE-family HTH domain
MFISLTVAQKLGKAGKALRQVLEIYCISQNKLAVVMGTLRSIVFKWYKDHRDPMSEILLDIAKALQTIEPASAKEFVRLYLGSSWNIRSSLKKDNSDFPTKKGNSVSVVTDFFCLTMYFYIMGHL